MHTVGTDHQVERALSPTAERDVDPLSGLVDGVDGVAEQEFHIVADKCVEERGQIPSAHLDVLSLDTADNGAATLFPTTLRALEQRNTMLRGLVTMSSATARPAHSALTLPEFAPMP